MSQEDRNKLIWLIRDAKAGIKAPNAIVHHNGERWRASVGGAWPYFILELCSTTLDTQVSVSLKDRVSAWSEDIADEILELAKIV